MSRGKTTVIQQVEDDPQNEKDKVISNLRERLALAEAQKALMTSSSAARLKQKEKAAFEKSTFSPVALLHFIILHLACV